MNTITELYKKSFIEAVISANTELYSYINTKLSLNDLKASNSIGYGGDKTLNIDLIAENIFIKHLKEFGNIYSEECGKLSDKNEFLIIIDPIDGSDNMASSLPYYGTSVALQLDNITIAGFVCNLVTSILIYKAFDEKIVNISLSKSILSPILINENSNIGIFERAYNYPLICQKFYENKIKYRSPGAIALSLSNAKNYNFVLIIGTIREFDIAGALYISSDLFTHQTDKFLLISKNKRIFSLIKEILKEKFVITPHK